MKKINVYVNSVVRWAAYKKESEYQAWIDYAVANNLWGQPGSYTVEVVDATEEIEQKRLQAEGAKKQDFDAHASSTSNPHSVTKAQVGLSNVDDVSASSLRDRSTHTGTQSSTTISDFTQAVQSVTSVGVLNLRFKTTQVATATQSAYIKLSQLTTPSLAPGLYRFRFFGRIQSGSGQNGVGIRMASDTATVTTMNAKWFVSSSSNTSGSNSTQNMNYNWDQLDNTTNVTTGSPPSANATFNATGEGIFRVTQDGTVGIELRSELNTSSASILEDSYLEITLL